MSLPDKGKSGLGAGSGLRPNGLAPSPPPPLFSEGLRYALPLATAMSLPTVDPGTPGSNVDNFSLSAHADNENYRGALPNSQPKTKHPSIPQ